MAHIIIDLNNPPSGKLGTVISCHLTRDMAIRKLKQLNKIYGKTLMIEEVKGRLKKGETI